MTDALPMSVDSAALVAELPDDLRPDTDDTLRALVAQLAGRPVPTSRLARLWVLGSMQTRVAAAYLVAWVRQSFGDQRAMQEAHLRAALRLMGGMGYLRGAMAKVGQMLASYPAFAPERVADLLTGLCFEAPPMHYALLREMVRAELGDDPEARFDTFDPEPFAAASLGQVHGARLGDDALAVKVQYPAMDRAIDADFANLRAFAQPLRLLPDWDHFLAQGDDIRASLRAECDYERELAMAERLRAALADDTRYVVPRTFPHLSSRRVLTMERLDGDPLPTWLAGDPPQAERDRVGQLIWRLIARLYYRERVLPCDVNPGNLLVLRDGRLGLVDFGAYRPFTDIEWDAIAEVLDAAESPDDDSPALRRAIARCADRAGENVPPRVMEPMLASTRWFWEPLLDERQPFDFADADYLRRGAECYAELMRRRVIRTMPIFIHQSRCFYGVRGLLYRLRARFDARATHHEELRAAGITPCD